MILSMKKYHYKAFISYRHLSPDQDIARKLHKLIETYGIPSSLKKSLGIQKMGRVFRDQEELPLSSDLGHDIHEALDESEWFICICSPRYLESKWCMEELNYFINSGRRDHVLAILVEGEPEASFPEQIRFEYRGGKLIENEPLAADVRASNIQDALKKLNNEKLRIMAPMLDVRYDDLKQRDRIRKNRIIFSAALAVIALLSMFLIYALNKNRQITNERNEALIAESKWLSKSAKEALDNNDRMLSLLLYLEALPEDVDNPDRPIIDEAGNGLISALIGSDATSSYSGVSEIFIDPDENRHVIDLVAIDNRLYLTRRNTIEIYDLDSGAYLGDLDTNGETIYGSFIRSSGDYYVYHFDSYEQHHSYTDPYIEKYEDSYQYEKSLQNETEKYGGGLYTLTHYSGDSIKAVYGDKNYFHTENQSWKVPDRWFDRDILKVHVTNEEYLVTLYDNYSSHIKQTDYEQIYLIDKFNEIVNSYSYQIAATDYYGNTTDAIASPDGSVIFGMSRNHLYLWNRNSAELFRTISVDRFDNTEFVEIKAPSQNKYDYIAVLTEGGNVYLYDFVKDEVLLKMANEFYKLGSIMFNHDGKRLLCSADRNNAIIFSLEDGSMIENLQADFHVYKAEYAVRDYYGNAALDNYILLFKGDYGYRNSDWLSNIFIYSTNIDDEINRYKTSLAIDGFTGAQFSTDNETLWLSQCGTNVFKSPLNIFDLSSGKLLKTIEDHASVIFRKEGKMMTVARSGDLGLSGLDRTYVRIYDEKSLEEITTLYPAYEHLIGINNKGRADERANIAEPFFSADRRYMFLQSTHASERSSGEAFVFVYDVQTWEELWHVGSYDVNDPEYSSFMEETDGYEGTMYLFAYPAGNDRILICYEYVTDAYYNKYSFNNLAFEIRDAKTGEVLDGFVPEGKYLLAYSPDRNQIGLFTDEESYAEKKPAYVFNTDSFENLADKYVYEEPQSEENSIELSGSILTENDGLMLVKGKDGSFFVLRIPTLKEAITSARIILNGKTLTDEQKEKYFLE